MANTRACRGRRPAGFTLIELLVVVLIIGILSALMIPGYTKSVESSKADDAAGVVTMIGQANRMYYLDNANGAGITYAAGTLTNNCNNGTACPSPANGVACELVYCHYLGSRVWDSQSYTYSAGSNCPAPPSGTAVACAARNTSIGNPQSPYSTWGYVMNDQGVVTPLGTPTPAPTPMK